MRVPVGPRLTVGIGVIGVSLMGDWTQGGAAESHLGIGDWDRDCGLCGAAGLKVASYGVGDAVRAPRAPGFKSGRARLP
jgi:hypothetical protein